MFLDVLEHFLNVLLETLLQHFICLIKASYLQLREIDDTSFKQVQESPRS